MLDAELCGADLSAAQESLQDADTNLQAQIQELEALTAEHDTAKSAHDLAAAQLEDERAKLSSFDNELAELEATSKSKTTRISDEALEVQKLGHQIENFSKQQASVASQLQALEKEHDWVAEEAEIFGRPGTAYDFSGQNMGECRKRLASATERISSMKKKINPKVMNMIDSVEKKEASLKQMMRTVVKDKAKIEETIGSLDEYKKEALQRTWEKVNRAFGAIFDELLPGNESDGDEDGARRCAGDCDDTDPEGGPAMEEICDGLDTDCEDGLPSRSRCGWARCGSRA